MSGYIKLHRAVRGTAIAQHPEYFAAWVHLLCMASHKAHKQVVGTKVVALNPGQLVFGRQKFSATTGISENKVRASLNVLKELNMITSKSHSKFSVITITNWLKYQESSPADNHKITSTQPALNHEQEGSKNGENVKTKDTSASALDYSSWPGMPSEQILKDWRQVRKTQRAAITQTVINRFGKELHEAQESGLTVDDCLSECVVKGWRGFEAKWIKSNRLPVVKKKEFDYVNGGWK